ncbi:MAG TPA: hypothetical protein VLR26_04565 [Frankiaceae bacterium]|nr:hypothetical protein [Frankiaceae bacterium]
MPSATRPAGPTEAPSPSPSASAPDAGALPQTRARPRADSELFSRVTKYFDAVRTGNPAEATDFFFPLSAYRQVKGVKDPAADYRDRLLRLYALDIAADHRLLGPDAAQARLLGIDIPENAARWVRPGEEYNKIGYWRVYGARLRYAVGPGGETRSYGLASLISWRGRWYVVHLGPINRSGSSGLVCSPDPRTSAPHVDCP